MSDISDMSDLLPEHLSPDPFKDDDSDMESEELPGNLSADYYAPDEGDSSSPVKELPSDSDASSNRQLRSKHSKDDKEECSGDSLAAQLLYSQFLKADMEDDKEDIDFEPSSKDEDSSDDSDTSVTETEEEHKLVVELDSDDERLITLDQLQRRQTAIQAKVKRLTQMTTEEIEALSAQILYVTDLTEKKLSSKYLSLVKTSNELEEMERLMRITIEMESSKNEFETALGTQPQSKKSRRELQFVTKHIDLAQKVATQFDNVKILLEEYLTKFQ